MKTAQGTRVFIVDDEQVIALTLATILEKSGFDAVAFTNPVEALEAARKLPPSLVISDVVMPEMSGIDLAIQLKDICPKCKILLFSGQAATADLLKTARQDGHNFELLAKPIHPGDLLRTVHNLGQQ
jgi:CheY-like chemotaxis protein